MIVASQSPFGRSIFSFWMLQNAFVAILTVASFMLMYNLTPPEFRKFLRPPVLW